MPEFRVTFGNQYAHEPHPLWPPAHPDGWLTIEAPNERAAREAAFNLVGRHWCNLYPADAYPEDDVMYPRGELGKITTPIRVAFDREQMIYVLVYHQRANIEGCRCGWSELGRSHPLHVVEVYEQQMNELEAGRE